MKNKIIVFSSLAITALMFATPVFVRARLKGEGQCFLHALVHVTSSPVSEVLKCGGGPRVHPHSHWPPTPP